MNLRDLINSQSPRAGASSELEPVVSQVIQELASSPEEASTDAIGKKRYECFILLS
jgi:hypothetical protein